MIKKTLNLLILSIIIFSQYPSSLHAGQKTSQQKSVQPETDAFVKEIVTQLNNTKIQYDGKTLKLYANPSTENLEAGLLFSVLMQITSIVCAIASPKDVLIFASIAIIILFVEIALIFWINEKRSIQNSTTPYIELDDKGINLNTKKISWHQISKLERETTTKSIDGWEISKTIDFNFYDKALNYLFRLRDQDSNIPMDFSKLITIIYHYLTKANVIFTESVNDSNVYTKTEYIDNPSIYKPFIYNPPSAPAYNPPKYNPPAYNPLPPAPIYNPPAKYNPPVFNQPTAPAYNPPAYSPAPSAPPAPPAYNSPKYTPPTYSPPTYNQSTYDSLKYNPPSYNPPAYK